MVIENTMRELIARESMDNPGEMVIPLMEDSRYFYYIEVANVIGYTETARVQISESLDKFCIISMLYYAL